jgi:hypothetical protein
MSPITSKDWSFEKIRACDPTRSARLESCGAPRVLISALAQTVATAKEQDLRVGADSICNKFKKCRIIVQFKISPGLYDWFFNGRTGYRAWYWEPADYGLKLNKQLLSRLRKVITERSPEKLPVRKIRVDRDNGTRSERDVGKLLVSRSERFRSLEPGISKIWIGEFLIGTLNRPLTNILFPTLSAAAQSSAKLCIPRWANAKSSKTGEVGEGLRAPLPEPKYSWLDLKGGFLAPNGRLTQIKPQDDRAKQIHGCGWKPISNPAGFPLRVITIPRPRLRT